MDGVALSQPSPWAHLASGRRKFLRKALQAILDRPVPTTSPRGHYRIRVRETKRGQCCLNNNLVGVDQERLTDQLQKRIKPSWWVPHPKSGIYYPMGHERVMDDVPKGAAHSDLTYWLRGSEGVDEPSNDPSFDGQ